MNMGLITKWAYSWENMSNISRLAYTHTNFPSFFCFFFSCDAMMKNESLCFWWYVQYNAFEVLSNIIWVQKIKVEMAFCSFFCVSFSSSLCALNITNKLSKCRQPFKQTYSGREKKEEKKKFNNEEEITNHENSEYTALKFPIKARRFFCFEESFLSFFVVGSSWASPTYEPRLCVKRAEKCQLGLLSILP